MKADRENGIKVELANYKGLKVKRNQPEIKEQEIDNALDYLRKSRAKIITINQPAQEGNRVEIDFEIKNAGVKIENGTSRNHPLILGENRFLPGFEENLQGMKSGEEKEFLLKAPDDWPDKRIANKNLDFRVKMNLVQERILPDINDEFAKSLGNFDSLAGLRSSIRDGLMQEKELKEEERMRLELIEKIAADSKMNVPQDLINRELEDMLNEFKASITIFGLDFETYLKGIKKTIEELKKEWMQQAEKRVRIGLCLQAISDKEGIKISDQEIEQRMNEELKYYASIEQAQKNIDLDKLREYTKNILINEKVFVFLECEAKII
jgi:trigger factor